VRRLRKAAAGLAASALVLLTAHARQVTEPIVLLEGTTVAESITADASFDLYLMTASQGEVYRAQVLGEDGFAPRLGVSDAAGDLLYRSDVPGEGITGGGDTAAIEWTIPADGQFRLVVTAAAEGDTGGYRITLQRLRAADAAADTTARTVTFLCNGQEAVTLAGIQMPREEPLAADRSLFIYTTGDLVPVIRVQAPEAGIDVCWQNDDQGAGDVVTLPDGTSFTITDETLANAALFGISQTSDVGETTVTFGALGGAGQFLALVGGFAIDTPDDEDIARLRNGPRLSAVSPLTAYMVAVGENNRLDPLLELGDETGARIALCDDAGGRGCRDVPPITGAGVVIATGVSFTGDRFDAGVMIAPENADWHTLTMTSFGRNTRGNYVLLLWGERAAE
jgi:hypothetical protein